MNFTWTLMLTVATTALAGDLNTLKPFCGVWELNSAKAQRSGQLVYELTGDGSIRRTDPAGASSTFKLDGKEYPSAFPKFTQVWKQSGERTWTRQYKLDGKVESTAEFKISDDGKTMHSSVHKGDGTDGEQLGSATMERVSGSEGLIGVWKILETRPQDKRMEIRTESDLLELRFPTSGVQLRAKLDGKDYPVTGPDVTPGYTSAVRPIGNSLEMVNKLNGQVLDIDLLEVSQDGMTLKMSTTGADRKKQTAINFYEKQ